MHTKWPLSGELSTMNTVGAYCVLWSRCAQSRLLLEEVNLGAVQEGPQDCPKLLPKSDTLKLKICTVYILPSQFVVLFTYTTNFMLTLRLSFRDYVKLDTHSTWLTAAPPCDVISIRPYVAT